MRCKFIKDSWEASERGFWEAREAQMTHAVNMKVLLVHKNSLGGNNDTDDDMEFYRTRAMGRQR